MERIKKVASSTKKFVHDHRVAIAVTVTTISTTAIALMWNHAALEEHDDFLKENNLYETYYDPTRLEA